MKKLFSIFLILCLCSVSVFADNQGDEYDDGYVYEANGAGDRFLKFGIGGVFPLNFGKQLKPGFTADINFYQFISNKVALGGEISLTTNNSIGNKMLFTMAATFDAMYQPTLGKFEFPLGAGIGFSTLTLGSMSYFPGISTRLSAGTFYRVSESWSLGVETQFIWLPEFHRNKKYNEHLLTESAFFGVRFHF